MVDVQPLVSQFSVVGKLDDLSVNSKGRVKCLYLSTPEASYSIEVSKKQHNPLGKYLQRGCFLKVSGMQKRELHRQYNTYKAYYIELLDKPSTSVEPEGNNGKKRKILVCQGSSCRKKGADEICLLLQQELHRQEVDLVEIQTTGCLKQCKQAPNLVVAGKNRYGRVQPRQIGGLIERLKLE